MIWVIAIVILVIGLSIGVYWFLDDNKDYFIPNAFLLFIIIPVVFGVVFFIILRKQKKEFRKQNEELSKSRAKVSRYKKMIGELFHSNDKLKECIKKKDELYEYLINDFNEKSIRHIGSLYADYLLVQYDISANYLETKKFPAPKEAYRIRELKKKTKEHVELFKRMEYKYEELFYLFPELEEYVEKFEYLRDLDKNQNIEELQENYDNSKKYLSREEYLELPVDERNQLALDRYIEGQKTNWQVGRDYEMYVAYRYRKSGWNVSNDGIEKKLKDLGRDLICYRNKEMHVVQCKRWSAQSTIHEKHIAQLYGTTVMFDIELNETNDMYLSQFKIIPVFVTTTNISNTAMRFAKKLGVKVIIMEYNDDFPRIKCNINQSTNEKIYHLPFDQQYDTTKIEHEGEFYARTVREAVSKGFRRAYRWTGN